MFNQLPQEILVEIFEFLPFDVLCRLKKNPPEKFWAKLLDSEYMKRQVLKRFPNNYVEQKVEKYKRKTKELINGDTVAVCSCLSCICILTIPNMLLLFISGISHLLNYLKCIFDPASFTSSTLSCNSTALNTTELSNCCQKEIPFIMLLLAIFACPFTIITGLIIAASIWAIRKRLSITKFANELNKFKFFFDKSDESSTVTFEDVTDNVLSEDDYYGRLSNDDNSDEIIEIIPEDDKGEDEGTVEIIEMSKKEAKDNKKNIPESKTKYRFFKQGEDSGDKNHEPQNDNNVKKLK